MAGYRGLRGATEGYGGLRGATGGYGRGYSDASASGHASSLALVAQLSLVTRHNRTDVRGIYVGLRLRIRRGIGNVGRLIPAGADPIRGRPLS